VVTPNITASSKAGILIGEGRKRVVIQAVSPEVDCGRYPIKRAAGESVVVTADIIADGHDIVSARLLYCREEEPQWSETPMKLIENDRWMGQFSVREVGSYLYTIEAWVDGFRTWRSDLTKRVDANQHSPADVQIGAVYIADAGRRATEADAKRLLEFARTLKANNIDEAVSAALSEELLNLMESYPDKTFAVRYYNELGLLVERSKALFSTWYEFFPRSCSPDAGTPGTFKDCERILPEIARMGFDVLYFPPVHPIGITSRKGKNNSLEAGPDDVGSPWAIGAKEGGHKSIHPQLGTMEDFEGLVAKAKEQSIEIAMDLAFQCSPDHPYVKEHPQWFRWRPDGTVQFAENPPKKYQDIIPINFETEDWRALWEELKSVVFFWIDRGIRIFRVDNPHTKPFPFWEWLISETRKKYPDVIFLSEAFTRPKVMYRLAKHGFSQSYTYFTWRNTKREFVEYLTEITKAEAREYFRPNFWPNTPDILPEHLQYGGRPAFMARLVLAATLSSSYGIYGPAFELCISEAIPGREEYLDSEKFEIKRWDWDQPGNLRDFIARVNRIRKENPALQTTYNLQFYDADNETLLFYGKAAQDLSNIILVVVNLDPFHAQSGWVHVPIGDLGIDPHQPYLVHDLLSDDKYIWQGERNYVELNPRVLPANIFRLRKRLKRETDFDYFM
jgi:starch synthase (maltosyl-transferring)